MIHNIDGISQTVQYQGCMIPISWELKMNERIKELKQQAADYVDSIDNGIDIEEYRKLLDQKFAELIVQECGNWFNSRLVVEPDYSMEHRIERNRAVVGVMKEFNQHFGVKQ